MWTDVRKTLRVLPEYVTCDTRTQGSPRITDVSAVVMELYDYAPCIEGIAEFAGLEFAGLENDGRSRRGGICRTGKW